MTGAQSKGFFALCVPLLAESCCPHRFLGPASGNGLHSLAELAICEAHEKTNRDP
jgi:hypothetical protein